ncbi:MAG: hypothetical protein Greene041662_221 [Candidatus Peregrinibacteria bacterium Greene0416_62]|nr:MAG: hypothetical protein Greene041662_221 [Candidatus Peregrinibacteria bacterium Greene0416_62]TSC98744.1 MAG: hypothetical protein Greene101449_877 [Candidatus Peregrinibacteria bacterium Greene1014_49]
MRRFPEIDVLRTTAILGMVIYHTAYDLAEFYGWNFDPLHGGWWLLARSTAVLFLLVSGASNTIANARARNTGAMWRRAIVRSLQIAVAALLLTVVTYFFNANTYIRFGILHCIALSVLLLPLFQNFRQWNLLLGIGIIVLGNAMMGTTTGTSLLLPFGIMPFDFISLDYFPLLPWFGVVLMGSAVADYVYRRKEFRGIHLPSALTSEFSVVSRWSLVIYLAHQPVILLILILLFGRPTP